MNDSFTHVAWRSDRTLRIKNVLRSLLHQRFTQWRNTHTYVECCSDAPWVESWMSMRSLWLFLFNYWKWMLDRFYTSSHEWKWNRFLWSSTMKESVVFPGLTYGSSVKCHRWFNNLGRVASEEADVHHSVCLYSISHKCLLIFVSLFHQSSCLCYCISAWPFNFSISSSSWSAIEMCPYSAKSIFSCCRRLTQLAIGAKSNMSRRVAAICTT